MKLFIDKREHRAVGFQIRSFAPASKLFGEVTGVRTVVHHMSLIGEASVFYTQIIVIDESSKFFEKFDLRFRRPSRLLLEGTFFPNSETGGTEFTIKRI